MTTNELLSWEEKFEDLIKETRFAKDENWATKNEEDIKDFIRVLLATERQTLREKVDGLKEVYTKDEEFGDEGDEKVHCDSEWNEALDSVLALLNNEEMK